MDFGAHLPLIGFDDAPWTLERLRRYTETARRLDFAAVAANDHFVFAKPWLDGPTALAAVLSDAGNMELATTVTVAAIRGPVAVAKTMAALDILSAGRFTVGVGPGSSPRDYEAVGIAFEERWKRLDECVRALRALWRGETYAGTFYSTDGIDLRPRPRTPGGPPVWIGSWGSEAGMRRVARLADGWLASAYNTTPAGFAGAKAMLDAQLERSGKDPARFPNALATMFMYVTDDRAAADRIVVDVLAPMLRRSEDEVRERLLIGDPASCAEKLAAYRDAGLQRCYVWPVADEVEQLELFRERVVPLMGA